MAQEHTKGTEGEGGAHIPGERIQHIAFVVAGADRDAVLGTHWGRYRTIGGQHPTLVARRFARTGRHGASPAERPRLPAVPLLIQACVVVCPRTEVDVSGGVDNAHDAAIARASHQLLGEAALVVEQHACKRWMGCLNLQPQTEQRAQSAHVTGQAGDAKI